jgi:hypothetical protein
MVENNFCKQHSGVEEVLSILKENQEDILKTLPECIRAKTLWTFLSIFIVLFLAVIGFLWNGQSAIGGKVDLNQKEIVGIIKANEEKSEAYREKITGKVNLLMWKNGIQEKDFNIERK